MIHVKNYSILKASKTLIFLMGCCFVTPSWADFDSGAGIRVHFDGTSWGYTPNTYTGADPTGSQNNTFENGLEVSGQWANISNWDTGVYTNNISGGLNVINGILGMYSYSSSSGTLENQIDTLNLSGGEVIVGGGYCTTNVSGAVNWSGGTLTLVHNHGSFGDTTFGSLDITGSVVLNITDGSNCSLDPFVNNGTFKLFTVTGNVSGATADNITVETNMSFAEVVSSVNSGNEVVYRLGDTFYVGLAPTSTTLEEGTSGSLVDFTSSLQKSDVAGAGSASTFAPSVPSPQTLAGMRLKLREAMRQNPNKPWENFVYALSENNAGPQVLKFKGDYRLWASPYSIYTRNTGSAGVGTGFTEKDYGMLVGASRYIGSLQASVSGVVGFGLINQQMAVKANNKTDGKQFLLGLTANKKIFEAYEWISSLYGVTTTRHQKRQGDPDGASGQRHYMAKSDYRTYLLSLQNELGRVFKLQDNWSFRPLVGLQVAANRRTAFSEMLYSIQGNIDPTVYAQKYRAKTNYTGEAYTGMGVRKKWDDDKYEGKVTCSYEVGQKSGNGKARTDVAAGNQSLSISSNTPGRFTQYINVYGSLLSKQSNWKFIPSATVTLQRGQRSLTSSMKAEYRF